MTRRLTSYIRAGYLHPVAGALAAAVLGAPCWAVVAVLLVGAVLIGVLHA